MKVILQRAKDAEVTVKNASVGKIENGFVALVGGITHGGTQKRTWSILSTKRYI